MIVRPFGPAKLRLVMAFCTLLAVAPCIAEEPTLVVFMPPPAEVLAEVTEPSLRVRLLVLASDDQQVRQIGGCGETDPDPAGTAARKAEIDRRNTEELKERNCDLSIRNGKMEAETQLWMQRMRDEAFVVTRI